MADDPLRPNLSPSDFTSAELEVLAQERELEWQDLPTGPDRRALRETRDRDIGTTDHTDDERAAIEEPR